MYHPVFVFFLKTEINLIFAFKINFFKTALKRFPLHKTLL